MKVTGSNFTSQAVVLWNGNSLATSVVDSNTLAATVASSNVASPAVAQLQVQNVETGKESSPVPVTVASPTEASPVGASAPSLALSMTPLPSGATGTAYSANLVATGGTAGYQWSVTSGQLPAGLSLGTSNGLISGTPTSSGISNFGVKVSDSSSPTETATATFSMFVAAPPQAVLPLTITSSTLPGATATQLYISLLSATGGTAPYAWSITSGQLPGGLSITASTGVISGTPGTSGTFNFTATVKDSGSPAQTASVSGSILVATPGASPLTITTLSLPLGSNGTAYATTLGANGGTPAYTWSISSGNLPAGLTLAAASGVISGTPTATGTASFTATVSDNGNPVQTKSVAVSIDVVDASTTSGPGTTWFVRPDGGTRYSAKMVAGQCDGQADLPYSGTGTDQHCAFNDFRYMWDDDSGQVGVGAWIIAGGDTVVIRGCSALSTQHNPSNPSCRIGWDINTGGGPSNNWCGNIGNNGCYNPPIPAGTAAQPTRILGGCAYGTYTCTPVNTYPLTSNNLTQLFGGMGLTWTFNLKNTQYVQIEGIELTTHNGVCTLGTGANSYPRTCSSSSPLDDYAQDGFQTNNMTANITFQDVYVHGFNSAGFMGPIGGPITMTRVFDGFNAFAGWNFDDGSDTPDAAGSSITASYVNMMGNGCYEQYPIVNTGFPAQACFDTNSGGFGDAWSGQDTELDSFVCDHCVMQYNTKDAFIGPHTQIKNLTITNSVSIGNMGAQMKWGATIGSNVLFENNLIVHNCLRMTEALPGAAQNFDKSTGLGGSYLTGYCRAGGNGFANLTRAGSTNRFIGNTIIAAAATVVDYNCGYYTTGNVFNQETNCSTSPLIWTNNIILGYNDPSVGAAPGLWYLDPGAQGSMVVTSSYNNEYGIRNVDKCGVNNITCSDPLLLNEPVLPWPGSEAALDVFNPFVGGNSFYPTSGSPLIGAGTAVGDLTTDYYGVTQPNPPTIGAVQP